MVVRMMKMGVRSTLQDDLASKVIQHLFPKRETADTVYEEVHEEILYIKNEEIAAAGRKIKTRKAPGPDQVPAEVIKLIVIERPGWLKESINRVIEPHDIPAGCKEAK